MLFRDSMPQGAVEHFFGGETHDGSRGMEYLPLAPKTMKNEGFQPQYMGYNR